MTLTEVRRVLSDTGARLEGNEPDVPLNECAYLKSQRLPSGIGLMFSQGRVVRIDVFEPFTKTSTGAGAGDSEDRIKKLYPGRIQVAPHPYVDEGHYLMYTPTPRAEPQFGMVFETDGRRVTSFRVGTLDAIALIEGCS